MGDPEWGAGTCGRAPGTLVAALIFETFSMIL